MGETSEDEKVLSVEEKSQVVKTIEELKASMDFPAKVERLMATPEWTEVIEEAYINAFAVDLVRNYDEWEDDQKAIFDAEYKTRSGFINTMQAWARMGVQAKAQIERLETLLAETKS